MAKPMPWAVLVCRYSDDHNDPATTRLKDLHAQWKARFGDTWLASNLTPDAATDGRTILNLYETFFTISGLFTYNLVRYFHDVSHGRIYIGDSKVFPCLLDIAASDAARLEADYIRDYPHGGFLFQQDMFRRAKAALRDQHQEDWTAFAGVVVSFQDEDGHAQGWTKIDGGPGVFMGIKNVRNRGTMIWGHEYGHAFGLGHSYTDGDPTPYRDPFDIMSAATVNSFPDPSYGRRGPGMSAWNMRYLGWLDESRVWKPPADSAFSEVVQLRPLHKHDLPGYLAAEVPGTGGDSAYLVEFRVVDEWDQGCGWPHITVHRMDANKSHIMLGTSSQQLLKDPGHRFVKGSGPFSAVKVLEINASNMTARVQLCHSLEAPSPRAAMIEPVFAGGASSQADRAVACRPLNVAGSQLWFKVVVVGSCLPPYKVLWGVTGTSILYPSKPEDLVVPIAVPDPSVEVILTVTVTFDDGVTVVDTHRLRSISIDEAHWIEFLCELLKERKGLVPWWRWTPEKLRDIAKAYSQAELKTIRGRIEHLAGTLAELEKLGVRKR